MEVPRLQGMLLSGLLVLCTCLLAGVRVAATTCPGVCFCPSLSQIVYCPRKGLPFIPSGIPADTMQLNLNDNLFFPTITRENFTRFTELQQLYLTGCGIEYIEVDTFIDNKKLKWLDIGKNKLKTISDFTFRDLTLEHLFLNDNPGVVISTRAFAGLKTMGLYIQNNSIDKLSLEVLRPLNGSLKTLWMDGNKFELFNKEWLYLFKTLSHLRIGDNPLHCNCEAVWMFEFYQSTSRIFEGGSPPSCRSPSRLRGRGFSDLADHDFRCQLPVFKNVDAIFESNLVKLTCLASGDPVPTIYWRKPSGKTEVFIPKSEDISKEMEGVMYVPNPSESFTGKNRYQCVASNPAGNVTFSLNVAWPTVPEPEPDVFEHQVDQADAAIDPYPPKEIPEYDTKPTDIQKDEVPTPPKESLVPSVNVSSGPSVNMASSQHHTEIQFTMVDIVGAVVGTFLLTLLACLAVFHLFYRSSRKAQYPHQSPTPKPEIKRGPPSRYELDEVEHSMKMLGKNNYVVDGIA